MLSTLPGKLITDALPDTDGGLTPQERKARKGKITASRVGAIMSGNRSKLMALYNEMVTEVWGERPPGWEGPEDLSKNWKVQLGTYSEPLNLRHYYWKTGHVIRVKIGVIDHPQVSWAAATPDGFDVDLARVIECKHVGGHEPLATVHARYMPQVHWQMDCCRHLGITGAVFSVAEKTDPPKLDHVEYDAAYGAELWRRAAEFMRCVETLTPPFPTEYATPPMDLSFADVPVAAPPPSKEHDMEGKNEWASHAATWLETYEAADRADDAEKELKRLMPNDAKRSYGHGVEITRDRAGKMKLRKVR